MTVFLDYVLPCLGIAALVGVIAFFAASETAFLSITRVMLHQMLKKENGKKGAARKIADLKKDTNKLLSLILIGINFVTALTSGLAASLAIKIAGDAGSAYATFIIAFILIIFGEIMPKTVAAVYPVQTASRFAGLLTLLQKIFFPVVWVFSKITACITKFFSIFIKENKELITEEELKSLIAVGENEGTLETNEKRMLYKIFEFTDLTVHDIMRHKSQVKFVPEDADFNQIADLFSITGYSRLPVCRDSFENVLGVLYYKRVLLAGKMKDGRENTRLAVRCMRPALFIPETITATQLLQKFRKENVNFAVAVDENGSNIGIVTMDDILREVFGHMTDEYGMSDVPPESRITLAGSNEFLVPGDMQLDDLNEVLNTNLESENFTTLGGWLLEKIGELPGIGAVYKNDKIVFIVEDQSSRRIQSVRVKFLQQ